MTSPGSGWADSQVDDQERAVLSRVFSRISETTVSPDVWQEVCQFKERYQIP